jgi:superfamily I DNA/RNA helicase/mRNA-degrading endonuclease RelE of RelBE toxin-antitoxin system
MPPTVLNIVPAARADLIDLPKGMQQRINQAFKELETGRPGDVKPLKGAPDFYRKRVGDYRMIYTERRPAIVVLAIGHRSTIYDRLALLPQDDDVEPSPGEVGIDAVVPTSVPSGYLPRERLEAWNIPAAYRPGLARCRDDDDLLAYALEESVPYDLLSLIIDLLYAKSLDDRLHQPRYVVDAARFEELLDPTVRLSQLFLQLDPRQEAIAFTDAPGPHLVTGGPGSGKSIVALYRVMHLLRQARERGRTERVLFTTFTRALTRRSAELLKQLLPAQDWACVDFETADAVAAGLWRSEERQARHDFDNPKGLLARLLRDRPDVKLARDFLFDEFELVIEFQRLRTEAAYLEAKRPKRQRLSQAERKLVWSLYEAWQAQLSRQGLLSRSAYYEACAATAERRDVKYDHVVVDEAQDLHPRLVSVLVNLARAPEGVYITADGNQSIYRKGFDWTRIHAELRITADRLHDLKANYRTSGPINAAVKSLLDDEEIAEETLNEDGGAPGPKPVAAFQPADGMAGWLVAHLRDIAAEQRIPHAGIALLAPTNDVGERWAKALTDLGLPAEFFRQNAPSLFEPKVKVMTFHSAKGLEFPVVALVGLEEGVFPRPLPYASEAEREEDYRHQLRLLYVAASRAMRHLVAVFPADRPSAFYEQLDGRHWAIVRHGGA